MKIKLSKEIEKTKNLKPQVLKYFSKVEATPENIASYCSMVGVPIIATYYFLINDMNKQELQVELERLCKFYNIEVDSEKA